MSIKFSKYDEESYENAILRDGLPSQWEIVKETGQNMFKGDIFSLCPLVQKEDARQTEEISEYDDIDQLKLNEYPMEVEPLIEYQLCSNPCSGPDFIQNQESIQCMQVPNCAQIISKKDKKIRKSSGRPKKRKSIVKISKAKQQFLSQTKNIPKNYGKQIIKFIKDQKQLTKKILTKQKSRFTYQKLMEQLKKKKKCLNKIADLRKLWAAYDYSKEVRILTGIFLRKYSISWIFNSRIQNTKFPIKYRYRIIQGVQKPEQFLYLKDF